MEILPVGVESHPWGRTEKENMKFIAAFRYFAKAPNKRKTSISLAGSEPAIPAVELLQTYTLDHTATSKDQCIFHNNNSIK